MRCLCRCDGSAPSLVHALNGMPLVCNQPATSPQPMRTAPPPRPARSAGRAAQGDTAPPKGVGGDALPSLHRLWNTGSGLIATAAAADAAETLGGGGDHLDHGADPKMRCSCDLRRRELQIILIFLTKENGTPPHTTVQRHTARHAWVGSAPNLLPDANQLATDDPGTYIRGSGLSLFRWDPLDLPLRNTPGVRQILRRAVDGTAQLSRRGDKKGKHRPPVARGGNSIATDRRPLGKSRMGEWGPIPVTWSAFGGRRGRRGPWR